MTWVAAQEARQGFGQGGFGDRRAELDGAVGIGDLIAAKAVDRDPGGGQGRHQGLGRGGQHASGLHLATHQPQDVGEKPLLMARAGKGAALLLLLGDVAGHAPCALPGALLIEQRRGLDQQTGRFAVGAPHPDLHIVEGLVRGKGARRDVLLDNDARCLEADQVLGGVAQGTAGRHKGEPAFRIGLPGELVRGLDQILVALPRFDQGVAQISFQGDVPRENQGRRPLPPWHDDDIEGTGIAAVAGFGKVSQQGRNSARFAAKRTFDGGAQLRDAAAGQQRGEGLAGGIRRQGYAVRADDEGCAGIVPEGTFGGKQAQVGLRRARAVALDLFARRTARLHRPLLFPRIRPRHPGHKVPSFALRCA